MIVSVNFVYTEFSEYNWSGYWQELGGNRRYWAFTHGHDMWKPDFNMKHWLQIDERGASVGRYPRGTPVAGPKTIFQFEQSGYPSGLRTHLTFLARFGASMSVSIFCDAVPV